MSSIKICAVNKAFVQQIKICSPIGIRGINNSRLIDLLIYHIGKSTKK